MHSTNIQVAQLWQRDRVSSIDDSKRSLQIAHNTAMLCTIKIELHYWWADDSKVPDT